MQTLRIATRKSSLAMWQAHFVRDALTLAHPGLSIEIIGMSTRGDKISIRPSPKLVVKGFLLKSSRLRYWKGGPISPFIQ